MIHRMRTAPDLAGEPWPALPLEAWHETYATLHMWMQIVGKVRLALAPSVNHWWHVPSYVSARGLTTSPIPFGTRTFAVDFDFLDHRLRVLTSDGGARELELRPRSVADFYRAFMDALHALGIEVRIWTRPVEIEHPIRFEADEAHAAYDAAYAQRCWRILAQTDRVLHRFRSFFIGKASPVHFFWGAFDMALTYFSGRPAPEHPGGVPNLADRVVREAYSHEVSSCGFWPGSPALPEPAFYAYAYPEPAGYREAAVRPAEAFYSDALKEFVLPYDVVRRAADPDRTLLAFLHSTYEAAADLGHWDRKALERGPLR